MATRGTTPVAGASAFSGFQLPSVGGPTDLSRGGLLGNYNANWQASRNANQDLYNRTVSGFDSILSGQQSDLAGVSNEYRQRQRAVMQGLTGANDANERDINQRFAQLGGQSMQDLISRGLGNSTVLASTQRGLGQSQADALTRSRNDFARQIADMRTQWGMASLNQKQNSALANSGLANQQANSLLQNTQIGYPDMGAYASMIASIPDTRNLDALLGGGGGGGMGGGGAGLLQFDPSRPVGGPGPQSSAFYGDSQMGGLVMPGAPGLAQFAPSGSFGNPMGSGQVAGFDSSQWAQGFLGAAGGAVNQGAMGAMGPAMGSILGGMGYASEGY